MARLSVVDGLRAGLLEISDLTAGDEAILEECNVRTPVSEPLYECLKSRSIVYGEARVREVVRGLACQRVPLLPLIRRE